MSVAIPRCAKAAMIIALLNLMPESAYGQELVPPGPKAPYVLREVGHFGSERYNPAPSTDSLTVRAGGDMFGRVYDMALDPTGSALYVLDHLGRKVVRLARDGTFQVLFTWREGEGPGEFKRPRGLAVTDDGIVVGDMGLPRISYFSTDGKFLRATRLPARILDILSLPDGLAISRLVFQEGAHQVLVLSANGAVSDSLLPLSGRLADFAPYGESGVLFSDGKGEPWLASPAAGLVCQVKANSKCSGRDLFPAVKGYISEGGSRGVGLGVRGAAQLRTGELLILVSAYRDVARTWLLVFDREMKYLGYIDAGPDQMLRISRGFGPNEFLVSMDEPFPRVVRYHLERHR